MHSCDNRLCVEESHLSEGTRVDNMQDAARKDRTLHGVRNPQAKLDPDKVKAIRASPGRQADLAKRYGVSRSQIGRVKQRKDWVRVT